MSYSVVLLARASEAVFQTALKRAEERLDGGSPQTGIGEVLVDIAEEENVALDQILQDRNDQKVDALLADMHANTDDLERSGKALIEILRTVNRMTGR
jgi:hypothetical protein